MRWELLILLLPFQGPWLLGPHWWWIRRLWRWGGVRRGRRGVASLFGACCQRGSEFGGWKPPIYLYLSYRYLCNRTSGHVMNFVWCDGWWCAKCKLLFVRLNCGTFIYARVM
jgi:hypothetical protein